LYVRFKDGEPELAISANKVKNIDVGVLGRGFSD